MDKENALKEMLDSVKFSIESKKGKYSLDTYLDILGEYTDLQIINGEKEGLEYIGGKCSDKVCEKNPEYMEFVVELYFENQWGEPVKREARRNIPLNKFVSETISTVGKETLSFYVYYPGVNK